MMTQKTLFEYIKDEIVEIPLNSEMYPQKLRVIRNPPKILYALGNLDLLNRRIVAIVGTRNVSKMGEMYARRSAELYAQKGYNIASGLAIGVDTIAMKSALNCGAKVIAILPSSIENIIPKSNKSLANEIVEKGGLLISEYNSNKIQKYHFIQRNRIISGLADLVVVVETSIKGGTMHTVKFAKEQGKKIIVADIPASGNRKLIDEGYEVLRI